MPIAMARQLVDFFYELDILSCIFIGGEPTLYKGLPELVRLAKDRGIEEVTVVSNGRRLSSSTYVQELCSAGVDLFSVTIHSIVPALHNAIAGVNAWQQTYYTKPQYM
jgi:molybdenum cofactor biosynthesis enzyme MoaA